MVCKEEKTKDNFYFADKNKKYLQNYCKKCSKDKSYFKFKENQALDSTYRLRTHYKQKFNLDSEATELLLSMATTCAICLNEFSSSRDRQLDHCHTTGKIRSFLCHKCNKALGLFKDNTKILMSAIYYLGRYK